ncbi:UNVERIFIED_CONTAM: hypothetical protein FKN15_008816 [Acipenser sinensis]
MFLMDYGEPSALQRSSGWCQMSSTRVSWPPILLCEILDPQQRKYSDRIPNRGNTVTGFPRSSLLIAAFKQGQKVLKALTHRMENIWVTSGLLHTASWESQGERMGEIRAKLRDSKMELMTLAWRNKRAMTLEKKIREVSQRIQTFQVMLGEKMNEMDLLLHRAEWKAGNMEEEMLNLKYRETAAQVQILEKHLKLEEYCQKILKGDWMRELEIWQALIHQIDMVV